MAQIPDNMKTYLKVNGSRFNRDPKSESIINQGLLAIAARAVGNAIADNEPYTIRINFKNGRIVGSKAQPRLTVELLDGRASTSEIDAPKDNTEIFIELKYLVAEGYTPITNEGSWVARMKFIDDKVKSVFVNRDFDKEDRELIETVLMRGLGPQVQL